MDRPQSSVLIPDVPEVRRASNTKTGSYIYKNAPCFCIRNPSNLSLNLNRNTKKMSKKSPCVFLDVSIDGDPIERMVFELFFDIAPRTAENFRALCTGEKGISSKTGKPLHYKGTFFHRIIKGSMSQAGDLLRRDGNFGESIYGEKFPGGDDYELSLAAWEHRPNKIGQIAYLSR